MRILSFIVIILFTCVSFSQTEEIIVSGNSKLHFKTYGVGKPILIINGGPGMDCEGFIAIAQTLSKMKCKTIIYDQRGTGKSSVEKINNQTITMDLMVSDIENLRSHLKIEKWTILGHSFGGVLASYYTTKHPETIDKLIFSSSAGINLKFISYLQERVVQNLSSAQRDSLNFYNQKMNNGDKTMKTLKLRAQHLANAYVHDKSCVSIIAERLTHVNYEINSLVINNLINIGYNCNGKFSNFHQPVLVLQGKNDVISVDTAKEIADTYPNSKLMLLENCSHYGWLDAKEIYLKSIEEFLNNN